MVYNTQGYKVYSFSVINRIYRVTWRHIIIGWIKWMPSPDINRSALYTVDTNVFSAMWLCGAVEYMALEN